MLIFIYYYYFPIRIIHGLLVIIMDQKITVPVSRIITNTNRIIWQYCLEFILHSYNRQALCKSSCKIIAVIYTANVKEILYF